VLRKVMREAERQLQGMALLVCESRQREPREVVKGKMAACVRPVVRPQRVRCGSARASDSMRGSACGLEVKQRDVHWSTSWKRIEVRATMRAEMPQPAYR